ncbi:hypothetical protein FKM82_009643 [Ascaphus truei]
MHWSPLHPPCDPPAGEVCRADRRGNEFARWRLRRSGREPLSSPNMVVEWRAPPTPSHNTKGKKGRLAARVRASPSLASYGPPFYS